MDFEEISNHSLSSPLFQLQMSAQKYFFLLVSTNPILFKISIPQISFFSPFIFILLFVCITHSLFSTYLTLTSFHVSDLLLQYRIKKNQKCPLIKLTMGAICSKTHTKQNNYQQQNDFQIILHQVNPQSEPVEEELRDKKHNKIDAAQNSIDLNKKRYSSKDMSIISKYIENELSK
ncbi:hypothetical protein FGO68_gene7872 [Halteria grandinella]|uniref:Transmembrane protein n=1 Tax=Halteria grandinella TaxID=5974 RepID=A0A8J8NGR2_HALGN|nr:hypothetical protein FGO68_gene7872 [Halteria grandinella]